MDYNLTKGDVAKTLVVKKFIDVEHSQIEPDHIEDNQD
jgi:hypothetical protein